MIMMMIEKGGGGGEQEYENRKETQDVFYDIFIDLGFNLNTFAMLYKKILTRYGIRSLSSISYHKQT